jgi:hypothetical protein
VLDGSDRLDIRRPFQWGILIIADPRASALPELVGGEAVVASDSAVIVGVRHAQDVDDLDDTDFEVAVSCAPGPVERGSALAFDGVLTVQSGRLDVGDANHWDALLVSPGRWRIQIETDPAEHPERLTVWLTPA